MSATEERFSGKGGYNIAFRVWRPIHDPRAVLLIVPGFNSHSGQYEWAAAAFAAAGFAVYAVDLRGRGLSDGERYFVDSFNDYVADLEGVYAIAREREPGLPVFVFGHSAGGVVASMFTLDHQADLAGLVCESFAFQVPAPDFALAVLKGLSHIAPHAHVLKLKNEDFSRDPEAVARLNADPLIAHETQPTKTVAEMVRADEHLKLSFGDITLPLLILHGTDDKATKPAGSQFFFDNARATDKTLKLYEGHYHDLLADIGKEDVLADIIGWLEARAPKS